MDVYVRVNLSNQAICKISDNCSQFVNRHNLPIFFDKLTDGETDNL